MSKLTLSQMLQLKRWNTPTIYNGWEAITQHDRTGGWFNNEETRDFMPEMGPMVGRVVTVVCEPSNSEHPKNNPNAWAEYRKYVASIEGPKIVVVQDLDKPKTIGSFWGEVNGNIHRALGCVGTITDGAIRDLDEMRNAGFKGIAKRMCVGHAYSWPVRWNCEVEVFGTVIKPGVFIHADKHGFLAIPADDEMRLLEAAVFMDQNECSTLIGAAITTSGKTSPEILASIDQATRAFGKASSDKMGRMGEW
jgi:4-hydroxy-4-methyl-2-oxoglutarate aldolase